MNRTGNQENCVEYRKIGHICIVTMNRPDKLNAINAGMMAELCAAWQKYQGDNDAWVAVLTGKGRAFTAGADFSWIDVSAQGRQRGLDSFQNAIKNDPFWSGQLDKPVIAAINGLAVGAGVDLVLRSDLRIASETAWFRQAEVERGNFMIFNENLPGAIAAELISGFTISAQRAYQVGILNRLVTEDKLAETYMEMAEELLTRVPLALSGALNALRDIKNAGMIVPRRMIDHYTTVVSKELQNTYDCKEATVALYEKRKPVFKRK